MNYFERADSRFVEEAASASLRQAAIQRLKKSRKEHIIFAAVPMLFAVILCVIAFISQIQMTASYAGVTLTMLLITATQLMLVFKLESDLRLLMVIEALNC